MATGQISLKKCGVKFSPPALVLSYEVKKTGKLHRRTMPLRQFNKNSGVHKVVEDLLNNPRHAKYVSSLPKVQLERLITIIRDKLRGLSVEESIKRNKELDTIDPNEDLNKADDETLMRKKLTMEESFERNRLKPGDPDFQYNIEMNFTEEPIESCGWDSNEESDEDF